MFVTAQSILKYTERGRARWGVEETPWQLPMHGAAVGVHNFGRVTATECSADAHRADYHSGRQGDYALLAHISLEVCEVRPTTPPPINPPATALGRSKHTLLGNAFGSSANAFWVLDKRFWELGKRFLDARQMLLGAHQTFL